MPFAKHTRRTEVRPSPIALRTGPTYKVLRKRNPLPPMPEAILQRQIIRVARLNGWREHFVFNSEGSPKGWPDLVLLKPPHALFWEVKTDRGYLTKDQQETLGMLSQIKKWDVRVVRPRDWRYIERLLREL